MAAATYLEYAMVLSRWQSGRSELDDRLLRDAIEIVPVDRAPAQVAADAFSRYDRGSHPGPA